jgi:hypothetical protein
MKNIYPKFWAMLTFCSLVGLDLQAQNINSNCSDPSFTRGFDACVWPGDTDGDGQVDNFDALSIGLAFGSYGNIRNDASTAWQGQPASDWLATTQGFNGLNQKHIDSNGDGLIDAADLDAIRYNYGANYSRPQDATINGAIPLWVESRNVLQGARLSLPILLGDNITPAENVYGLAFTIEYDATKARRGSIDIDFGGSILGSDLLEFFEHDEQAGKIEVTVSRKDWQNISSHGQLGTLNLTIRDDILRDGQGGIMNIRITNVRLIDNQNNIIGTFRPNTTLIYGLASGVAENTAAANMQIFPNPAQAEMNIRSSQLMQSAEIYNLQGQLVAAAKNIENNQFVFNTADLNSGLYLLQVQTATGRFSQKVQIAK